MPPEENLKVVIKDLHDRLKSANADMEYLKKTLGETRERLHSMTTQVDAANQIIEDLRDLVRLYREREKG